MPDVTASMPLPRENERSQSTLAPVYLLLAGILIVGLPLHTGFIHLGKALGVGESLLRLFQPWKDVLMAMVVVAVGVPVARGEVRVQWRFVVPAVLWALFLAYLLYTAALSHFDGAALYGLRVYTQPILAGFAIGVILRFARRDDLLPILLSRVSIAIALMAVLQAAFPTNAFVTSVRMATADAFGQLPSAMTVSVVSQFRAFATFADPNDLGFFAAIVLLGTLAPVFESDRALRVRFWTRAGAFATLAVSYSRSGLLAALVGFAVYAACALMFDFPRYVERAVRAMLVGMIFVGALALSYSALAEQLPQIQHLGNTVSGADPSARGHVSSLVEGLALFRARPEGYGLGRVGPRAELYRHGAGRQVHVESSYLQVGLEIGFAGMFMYIIAVIATLLAAIAMAGGSVDPDRPTTNRQWGRTLAAIIGAQLVGYLFLPTIISLQTSTIVWAYIGLLSGAEFAPVTATRAMPALLSPQT